LQKGLSDQGHDFVPVITPRERLARLSDVCRERERKRSGRNQFHENPPVVVGLGTIATFAEATHSGRFE
jgi:hypothetical protein